jgi:hypothetical protein
MKISPPPALLTLRLQPAKALSFVLADDDAAGQRYALIVKNIYPPPALLTMTLPAKDNSRSNHVCHKPLIKKNMHCKYVLVNVYTQ